MKYLVRRITEEVVTIDATDEESAVERSKHMIFVKKCVSFSAREIK